MSDAARQDTRREADAEGRRRAQAEFVRPVVIEAGAGTGKTATLVARILAWSLGPGWQRAEAGLPGAGPERIAERVLRGVVAITFTEAAAAEMDARVESALAALGRGERVEGFDGEAPPERVAALRGALDQLVVQTIHATCRRLLAAHPLEAGLHPAFEVDADGTARALAIREGVAEHLGERYAQGDADALALAEEGIGPGELEEQLRSLLDAGVTSAELERDPLSAERIGAFVAALGRAHRDFERAGVAGLAGVKRARKARAVLDALATASGLLAQPVTAPAALAELREGLLAAWSGSARNALGKWASGDFSESERAALADSQPAVAAAAKPLGRRLAHLERVDVARLARLAPLLASLVREIEEELRRRGQVGFETLLARTAALLARPAVAARIRGGIDQLLVDEFQDTDARQCAILAALALDGPDETRPGLFLVGDPKQSIYGWRSADLAAYEAFVERVRAAGGGVHRLAVNHRSVPAVLDAVERVIAPLMQRESGVQPAFEVLVPSAGNASRDGFAAGRCAPLECWVSAEADDGALRDTRATEAARLEARALAADLRALHDDHAVAWRDVGVLFRSRGDWDVYLAALREAGVPFLVRGDRSYYRRREILDAAALVRCVLDPHDQLALVAALRSAVAGVPDAAWLPLWARGFPEQMGCIEAPDPAPLDALRRMLSEVASEIEGGAPGLERIRGWEVAAFAAVEAIAGLRRSFADDPADLFVERLRASLVFEASEASRFLGSWRAANLEHFFADLAAQLAAGEAPSRLLRRLRQAVAEEERPSEEPASPDSAEAVSVLTLHGAKGLDWKHVYLMQLHKEFAPRRDSAPVGRVGEDLEFSVRGTPTLAFDRVVGRRDRVEEAERVRTLYVGMTRARERLVLCGVWPPFQTRRRGVSHAALLARHGPTRGELEARARAAARAPHGAVDAEGFRWVFPALRPPELAVSKPLARAAAATFDRFDPQRVREEAARWASEAARAEERMACRVGIAASELARGGSPASAARPRDGKGLGPVGRWVGSAIHRALEQVDLSADPAREGARRREALAEDLARSVPPAQREAAVREALACWDALAAGPLLERLRSLRERIVARELPVLLPPAPGDPATGYISGAVDLVYRDTDGALVVVDYKTDRPVDAADMNARREHYAQQGGVYRRALAEALGSGSAPRLELWWLSLGRVEEIAEDDAHSARPGQFFR